VTKEELDGGKELVVVRGKKQKSGKETEMVQLEMDGKSRH